MSATTTQLTRQRDAWRRRPRLECGCWQPCRCAWKARPSAKRVEAYAHAVATLAALGTPAAPLRPELEALHRRGGAARELAESVLRRWAA